MRTVSTLKHHIIISFVNPAQRIETVDPLLTTRGVLMNASLENVLVGKLRTIVIIRKSLEVTQSLVITNYFINPLNLSFVCIEEI